MPDCVCVPVCPFFNNKMSGMSAVAEMMKKRYCQGDNANCARWLVRCALGKDNVPDDLFPNQIERAQQLIGKK